MLGRMCMMENFTNNKFGMVGRYIAGIILGAGAGGGTAWYLLRRPQKEEEPAAVHHALKHGAPSGGNLRCFKNFVVCYDARLRNPSWVLEHITHDRPRGIATRKNVEFYEDQGLDVRFRSRLADFRDSGYDRGHMAPAANHKDSMETMLETFALTNVSPQVGRGFNRDYWARFERFVNLLTRSCDDVFVVTGPLYLPTQTPQGYVLQHPMIGQPPRMVAVPTHFFKVVLAERGGSSSAKGGDALSDAILGAFVLPNTPLPPDLPLTAFSVPLEPLEEAAGLQFFPNLLNKDRRATLDTAALAYQRWGRQQMKSKGMTATELPLLQPAQLTVSGCISIEQQQSTTAGLNPIEPSPIPTATDTRGLPNAAGDVVGQLHSSIDERASLEIREGTQQAGKKQRKRRTKPKAGAQEAWGGDDRTFMHVCEFTECKLPAADWYLNSKATGGDNGAMRQ